MKHLCNYLSNDIVIECNIVPEEKTALSNCCFIEDSNVSLSQAIEDSCTMDDIEDK